MYGGLLGQELWCLCGSQGWGLERVQGGGGVDAGPRVRSFLWVHDRGHGGGGLGYMRVRSGSAVGPKNGSIVGSGVGVEVFWVGVRFGSRLGAAWYCYGAFFMRDVGLGLDWVSSWGQ
jgi:hypothetical protein